MKNICFLVMMALAGFNLQAQYCGTSGGFQCGGIDSSIGAGYSPSSTLLPPFINNKRTATVIQFTSYDSIYFGTEVLYVYSTVIDSINNLPNGLCWTSDQDSNKYSPGQIGCVKIEGIPCDFTGQYKIPTIVTLVISGGTTVVTDGDGGGLEYFLRLDNIADPVVPVDTTQTDSTPILFYGGFCTGLDSLIVNLGNDETVCNGSIENLSPVITGGESPYTYAWQATGSSLNCDTCANPLATLTANATFILTVTDFNGNVGADTVNYTVSGPFYNFNIVAQGPANYCDSGVVTLASQLNAAATYQWVFNNADIFFAIDSIYTDTDSSGSYFLQYTLQGCQATSNIISLSFFNTPVALATMQGYPNICVGNVVILQADTATGLSYQWLLNGSQIVSYSATDNVTQGGSYQLVVTNALLCSDTSAAIILTSNSNPAPEVDFDYYLGDTICNNAGPTPLTGAYPDGGTYTGVGISANTLYPDSALNGFTVITYTYTDNNNCSNAASDTLIVENCTGIVNINSGNNLVVYPNPTSGVLNVVADFIGGKYVLNVYDVTGRRIHLSPYKYDGSNTYIIDVTQLPGGVYYIELTAGVKTAHASFIKAQ